MFRQVFLSDWGECNQLATVPLHTCYQPDRTASGQAAMAAGQDAGGPEPRDLDGALVSGA
jgi:hypothetical protein